MLLAMIQEAITGQVPYSYLVGDAQVLRTRLIKQENPRRPATIPDNVHGDILWSLLARCWTSEPMNRPPAIAVEDTVCIRDLIIGVSPNEFID